MRSGQATLAQAPHANSVPHAAFTVVSTRLTS